MSTRFPSTASVYEVMRTRPGAMARLSAAGLTREHMDYRITEAASAIGIPVERLTDLIIEGDDEPASGAPELMLAGVR